MAKKGLIVSKNVCIMPAKWLRKLLANELFLNKQACKLPPGALFN